jgi:hypothetical protein
VTARAWWLVVLGTAAPVVVLLIVAAIPSNLRVTGGCGVDVTGRNYKRIVLWAACLTAVFDATHALVNSADGVTNGMRLGISTLLGGAAGVLALVAFLSGSAHYFC